MTNLYEAGKPNKYYLKYDKETEGGWYFDICNLKNDIVVATSTRYDSEEEAVDAYIDMANDIAVATSKEYDTEEEATDAFVDMKEYFKKVDENFRTT